MDRADFEHEIRNAAVGVTLETRRIRQAMERLENHLQRMDRACAACEVEDLQKNGQVRLKEDDMEKTERELIEII